MSDLDAEKLKDIAKRIRGLNAKVKLIALLEKAHNEYEQNNLEDCIKTCKKVLKTSPNNPTALRGLGCVMQAQNKYKKALEYYNKALEFSQDKEIELTLIGMIYYLEGKLDEAIKYFNRAIDLNDNYDSAYEGRNQAMLENHVSILDLQDALIRQKLF